MLARWLREPSGSPPRPSRVSTSRRGSPGSMRSGTGQPSGSPRDGRRTTRRRPCPSSCSRRKGFRGNAEDYYDPRNSFLHHVLDRRLGISDHALDRVRGGRGPGRARGRGRGTARAFHRAGRAPRPPSPDRPVPRRRAPGSRGLRGAGRPRAPRRRPARPALAGAGHHAPDLHPGAQQPEGRCTRPWATGRARCRAVERILLLAPERWRNSAIEARPRARSARAGGDAGLGGVSRACPQSIGCRPT